MDENIARLEAILFAAGDPISKKLLMENLGLSEMEFAPLIDSYREELSKAHRGLILRETEETLQLATRPAFHEMIENTLSPIRMKSLSAAVLETLTVIAYRQPITRAEIEAIRGVRAEYAVRTLLGLDLIAEIGKKDTLGRPSMYGTTEEFLRVFSLRSLTELPQLGKLVPGEDIRQETLSLQNSKNEFPAEPERME